jgi:hypothetical protein
VASLKIPAGPADEGAVRKREKPKKEPKPSDQDSTREALDFCFEDVSSLRMLGAAPLSDLTSGPRPAAPASGGGPAPSPVGGRRWNLIVLAVLLLTLAGTTAAMLLGH